MGFFQSPVKLIDILKNKNSISESEAKPSSWFISEEGKQSFLNANTLPKKTLFFYEYLLSVAKYKENKEALYKIAFIMADSMVNSELEFGGFPNILDSAKNPLVAYIKTEMMPKNSGRTNFGDIYASHLICALHKEKYPNNYLYSGRKPYNRLTKQKPDGSFSDMYIIEREIIWSFCTDTKDKLSIGPYSYSICEADDDDSADKIEGFFAKEVK